MARREAWRSVWAGPQLRRACTSSHPVLQVDQRLAFLRGRGMQCTSACLDPVLDPVSFLLPALCQVSRAGAGAAAQAHAVCAGDEDVPADVAWPSAPLQAYAVRRLWQ